MSVPSDAVRAGSAPYRAAVEAFGRMVRDEEREIASDCRSMLFTHGVATAKTFVLFHGLTASPRQFVEFGRLLYERGANVFIPRLPHHGHSDRLTEELAGLTAETLASFARDSIALTRGLGAHVTVVGFSVGGLLAAWVAQHLKVQRAVAIAPFLGVAWLPHRFAPAASRLTLTLPNRFLWWDPRLREAQLPRHGYPRYATHAVAEAYRLAIDLILDVRKAPPATREIAVVLNASEITVNNRVAGELATLWGAHETTRVDVHKLTGLPRSHDIIEPLRNPDIVKRIYPELVELVDR